MTPIEVKDIRKGDLIRVEFTESERARWGSPTRAIEWTAIEDGRGYQGRRESDPEFPTYLLDRPTPPKPERYAVVIERDLHRLVDGMRAIAHDSERRRDFDSHKGLSRVFEDARTMLTAIDDGLPAVVVPSDALRELRLPPRTLTPPKHYYRNKIARFLAAVDEASA